MATRGNVARHVPGPRREVMAVSNANDAAASSTAGGNARDWWRLGAIVAAAMALVFAVIGLWGTKPPQDVLYGALQLFVLTDDRLGPPPYNPWLEIARFLAPATTAYAVFEALRAVLSGELRRRRIERLRGHAIVCGDDAAATLLAHAISIEQKRRVVLIGAAAAGPQPAGVDVVDGDPRNSDTLQAAGIAGAEVLIACASATDTNTAVALAAAQHRADDGKRFRALAEVDDDDIVDALRLRQVAARGHRTATVDFFTLNDTAARAVVAASGVTGTGGPIAIAGNGAFTTALLRAIARNPAPDGAPWNIVMRTDDPAAATAAAARLTGASRTFDLQVAALTDPLPHPTERIFVCQRGEKATLGLALRLLRTPGRAVTACLPRATPFVHALAGTDGLTITGILDEACHLDRIEGDAIIGRAARAIHRKYVITRRAAGGVSADDRSVADWEDLPGHLKESNYAQAEHIGEKLHAIGATLTTTPPTPPFRFEPHEIERLSRMEHKRWMAERTAAGFVPGPSRTNNHHPDLVEWSALTPESRQKDIDAVVHIPELLADADLYIVRGPRT